MDFKFSGPGCLWYARSFMVAWAARCLGSRQTRAAALQELLASLTSAPARAGRAGCGYDAVGDEEEAMALSGGEYILLSKSGASRAVGG